MQIFKPFFRVDSSRNADSGGVGLGLAITQRAINLHHGQVWAENAEPGLRVWVEIPLDRLSVKNRWASGVVRASSGHGATIDTAEIYELQPRTTDD